jgi:TolB protein
VDEFARDVQSGQLAYIGADGNIYVKAPDRDEVIAITDDATAPPEGPGLSYPRVAWSPDGQLAYASVVRAGNDAQARLYIKQDLESESYLVGVNEEHFVIYIYWSPSGCDGEKNCSRLTYLIEEPDGIGLRLVQKDASGTRNQLLGLGWPFYYSWSQDGAQMLWHTGGASRFNDDARLARYSLKTNETSSIELSPGLFIAPDWSPSAEEWLAVTEIEGKDVLQRISAFPEPEILEKLQQAEDKHIVFSWSPDGSRLAYSVLRRSGGLIFGPIHIHDLDTGKSRQITSSSFDISGFFWSPDGSRLAYLSRLPLREAVWMQWRVINVDTEEDRGYAAFNPNYQMRYVISSFNQYAQSHRLWSPDGRYLVYADQDDARVERIWMVDTFAERGTDPIFVAEGTMGFWSWE